MSRRERPAQRLADPAPKPSRGAAAPARVSPAAEQLDWDKFFQGVSASQREELVALARAQGILYSFQLPATVNGSHGEQVPEAFAQILAGQVDRLSPVHVEPVAVQDDELDGAQREAVAKALQTPDICLIQGVAGTGKSRVITEIVGQIAARGQRVLLMAAVPAGIDRVLEGLARRENVCALRCLGTGETPDSIPAAVRPFTQAAQEQYLQTQAVERARQRVELSQQTHVRLQELAPLWPRIDELTQRIAVLEDRRKALEERRASLAQELDALTAAPSESSPYRSFADALAEHLRARDAALVRIDQEDVTLREQIKVATRALEAVAQDQGRLQPLVNASKTRRFWSGAWWRALLRLGLGRDWADLEKRRVELCSNRECLEAKIRLLQQEGEQAQNAFQEKRAALVAGEVKRLQAELDEESSQVDLEIRPLMDAWRAAVGNLASEMALPSACSVEAVAAAQNSWHRLVEQNAQRTVLARQWATYLAQSHQTISSRLPQYVNVLAATCGTPVERQVGDSAANGASGAGEFDYLVLDDADQVPETELLKVARRARRWILVGQPSASAGQESVSDPLSHATRFSAAVPRLHPPFPHLWGLLHRDPRSLPYCWSRASGRLCCRLRAVTGAQQQWIEKEVVADFPEIELRILNLPQCRPVLAEILFPASFALETAKQYIYTELQELAVQTDAPALRWTETSNRIVLSFSEQEDATLVPVTLEPGMREFIHLLPANGDAGAEASLTAKIEFDSEAGWNRARSADWVARYVGLRDPGRTARLDVLHRMKPEVGRFVASVLGNARPRRQDQVHKESFSWVEPAVEFVAVPPLTNRDQPAKSRDRVETPAAATVHPWSRRGGAGIELDLADARQRDRITAELRNRLPREGIVNLVEAQAIVRALSTLAVQVSRDGHGPARHRHNGACVEVAVMALYSAQAELIRGLVERAPVLASAPLKIQIGVPAHFRHRETCIALLSLTRSHTHRPVAFAEDPHMLALALTRARARIMIFADAGTLLRRIQWQGPLEHLDQAGAAHEKQLLGHLVRYLDRQSSERPLPSPQGRPT
jgi:hypothetical protein